MRRKAATDGRHTVCAARSGAHQARMTQSLSSARQPARAATAAFIGTMIEWYDFYIYATAAALVFGELYFPSHDRFVSTMASFATFAVGFFARPLGGVIFGHLGDRIGRKKALMTTLMMMGVATVCVGLLPDYSKVGMLAPVLLVALRVVQGSRSAANGAVRC